MNIHCSRCDNEMFETGALVFGPPFVHGTGALSTEVSEKLHICRERCWPYLRDLILGIVIEDA